MRIFERLYCGLPETLSMERRPSHGSLRLEAGSSIEDWSWQLSRLE